MGTKKISFIINGQVEIFPESDDLVQSINFGDNSVYLPILNDSHVKNIIDCNGNNELRLHNIVNFLYTVGQRWKNEEYSRRRTYIRDLKKYMGYSEEMAKLEANWISMILCSKGGLYDVVENELGSRHIMDEWLPQDESYVRAFPKGKSVHLLAGNVPLSGIMSILRAILTKNQCIIKTSSTDPFTANALALSFIDVDPNHPITRSLSVIYWPHQGDTSLAKEIMRHADVIVAWGGPDAINWAVEHAPSYADVIKFGSKKSLCIIDNPVDLTSAATGAAHDVCFYDQRACFSAQNIYYMGNHYEEFKLALIEKLNLYAHILPNAKKDFDEKAAYSLVQKESLFAGLKVEVDIHQRWMIIESNAGVEFNQPLGRCVYLHHVDNIEQILPYVQKNKTQTISIFPWESSFKYRDALALKGAERIVEAGMNNIFRVGGSHDGMRPLQRLVTYISHERPSNYTAKDVAVEIEQTRFLEEDKFLVFVPYVGGGSGGGQLLNFDLLKLAGDVESNPGPELMENESKYKTIDHVICVEGNKKIHVWETLPEENSPKRKNAIIIASGFARRMDHFAGLAEYLSRNGFHVIRYDSLHHVGLSSGTIDEFTMSIGKQSLLAVVDWLTTRKINNFGMLASSLSARIAYASLSEINASFLITAVGVVNLRYSLERALGFDYLSLPINELPDNLDFEGHKLGAEVFARDCLDFGWEDLASTINNMMYLDIPFIAFTANNDNWVKQDEVITLLSNIRSNRCKIYSLLGSSHDLSENLVVLRNFYQSVTKAAIAMDNDHLDIDVDITEPSFEHLTIATVNERRMRIEIENQAISLSGLNGGGSGGGQCTNYALLKLAGDVESNPGPNLNMKFGNFLLTYQPPQFSQTEVMKRLVKLGRISEECGFDTVWLLEHHFTEFGLLGNPYVAAAYLLGATKKLNVGTAAIVLPTAHPVRQLEDVNLLDQMSKGRFRFGICRGLYNKDFRVFGTDMNNSRALAECWYGLIKNGMTEGYMEADNEHIKFHKVKVNPAAYSRGGAPVYVVAESASTTEWAAQFGLPMILSWIINTNEKKAQLELYNEVAQEYGHDIHNIDHCLSYITSVDHDSIKAKEICRKFLGHWYDSYVNATTIFDDSDQTRGYDFNKGQWRDFVLKGHKDTNRRIDYSYEINPVGTPQECIDIIQKDIDATGISNICCGFEANGTVDEIIASMKLFQSDVMPFLKEKQRSLLYQGGGSGGGEGRGSLLTCGDVEENPGPSAMKFGLFFLNFINSTTVQEQSIVRMQEITEYVDKLNFEQILVYENHFSGNGVVGAPLTVSGFLLGLTEKIKIGSLNHIITTHHPVRIAEEACLLDQLSEGRFILGFSDCEKKDEMRLFNRPVEYQQQLFEECYEIINDALTTGYCNPDNDFYSFPKISVNPHAYTQGGPRRYITATSHHIVEWAAKKGIPLIFKWDDSNDVRYEYAERYKAVADKYGIDLSAIDHQLMVLVNYNEDSHKAKQETRAFIRDYVLEMYPNENLENKLEEIITENAVGDYTECIAAAKLAIEKCGAKRVLLSFEPMNDLMHQKNVINIVDDNIKKYHMDIGGGSGGGATNFSLLKQAGDVEENPGPRGWMTSYVDKQEITASSEIDDLIFSSDPLVWSYDEQEKIRKKLVLDAFRNHYKHCREYRHYCQAHKVDDNITEIDDIPVFPTSVFKFTRLLTSQENEIESWFTSSGTNGLKSQVARDRLSIERLLGSVSYGMKYVGSWFDHQIELVNLGPDRFNAHNIWFKYVMSLVELLYPTTFTVTEERIDFVKTLNSLERIKNQGKDLCLIGSPYFIYLLCHYMKDKKISFSGDKSLYIITGGGWKSYEKESLKRDDFNHLLFDTFNLSDISQIRDIFNQVELNTCFFEDEMQRKHVPPWVYARALDPETLKPVPDGTPGLMSYMDASATSYPAFIVTDDVGIISREYGKYPGVLVEILRRVNTRTQKGCALSLTEAFDSVNGGGSGGGEGRGSLLTCGDVEENPGPSRMNNTIETILAHRSIRKFTAVPITDEQRQTIIQAGLAASSSSMLQVVSIVRVTDSEKRNELAQFAGNQAYVESAAEFLVFCIDYQRHATINPDVQADFTELTLIGAVDSGIMAQNCLLAAESMGLGGVYIGGLRNSAAQVDELLGLPENSAVLFGMCLGHPDQNPEVKPRLPAHVVVHENQYQELNLDDIQSYDQTMQAYYASRTSNQKLSTWSQEVTGKLAGESRPHILPYLNSKGLAKR